MRDFTGERGVPAGLLVNLQNVNTGSNLVKFMVKPIIMQSVSPYKKGQFLVLLLLIASTGAFAQLPWKSYKLTDDGDTINRLDLKGRKQGPWINHIDALRGEPGHEEEGWYKYDRKEGQWRLYTLMGDLMGIEYYKWGYKDSICRYYSMNGQVLTEQSWKALNPDKAYDTLQIEDIDHPDNYRTVIVKNEGASLKHGAWKYYDTNTGALIKTVNYTLGREEVPEKKNATAGKEENVPKATTKPKEVREFEKKHSGKKKVKYQDGTVNQ